MRDAFPVVCKLGDRLGRERTGWRDIKGLVLLVAQHGDWNGAVALADALGVHPDQQQEIYDEAYPEQATRTAPAHPCAAHHQPYRSTA